MTGAPAIRLRAVEKRFGRQRVLRGVDLEVPEGAFVGLVGVNGAGKTTSIKGLLDFCDIDAGRIEIFGVPHTEPGARARLAYLPERFLPPYFLTGRDFLRYMARLHGRSLERAAVLDMFERLELPEQALDRPVRAFSKGMAQKLGLAACFLSGRALQVLDEPMSGLDPKARILVKRHLRALRESGATVFFSTHMLNDVDELCDLMAVLHEGRVCFAGTPRECREATGQSGLESAYLHLIEGASAA